MRNSVMNNWTSNWDLLGLLSIDSLLNWLLCLHSGQNLTLDAVIHEEDQERNHAEGGGPRQQESSPLFLASHRRPPWTSCEPG